MTTGRAPREQAIGAAVQMSKASDRQIKDSFLIFLSKTALNDVRLELRGGL